MKLKPSKQLEAVKPGDRLLARVRDVQDKIAVLEALAKIDGTPLKYPRTGVVIARRGENLDNVVGVGDYAIVEVSSIYYGLITFDLYGHALGCIASLCSRCGSILEKRGNMLECGKCGSRERRKLALKYGSLNQFIEEMVRVLEGKDSG